MLHYLYIKINDSSSLSLLVSLFQSISIVMTISAVSLNITRFSRNNSLYIILWYFNKLAHGFLFPG